MKVKTIVAEGNVFKINIKDEITWWNSIFSSEHISFQQNLLKIVSWKTIDYHSYSFLR